MTLIKEISFTIDGRQVSAKEGTSILKAAREAGINIPTLCNHEKLEPYGACRICTVEIETKGRTNLVASCLYPIEDNLKVLTNSDKVIKVRKMILELILPYAPESKVIQDLSREYEVKNINFKAEPSFCILCGLCVRYCNEVKKKNAIGFIGRGENREVAFTPGIALTECPNCKECFSLCPTQALQANFVLTQALMVHSPDTESNPLENS